jgi:hypothetical protein
VKRLRLFVVIAAAGLGLGGCAAIGLTGAAIGAGTFSAGAGAAVRAGTEYTRNSVYRTFSLPLPELRLALSETLARMEIAVESDEMDGVERHIVGRAREREVDIRLMPLTRTMTQMKLTVAIGFLRKDRATASEIVVQVEHAVDDRAAASGETSPIKQNEHGSGASSRARAARR